ncbi:MAG: peptidoglycan-binding protein [Candidatus Harrisonbacteria bacterium]|nr:peptidoglycan-binding protein [Candidatus Harrisonbacteria bacterium]
MSKIAKKVASVALSATTVIWLSGSAMLMPFAAQAEVSIADLLAQIAALQVQLQALQSGSTAAAPSYSYTRNLTVGSRGDDVKALQGLLNVKGYLAVEPTGYFGSLTKAALAKYQAANGISPAAGYFGPITRASVSAMAAAPAAPGAPGAPAAPVVVPSGAGLVVALAANQPASSLAPASAARIPFTVVTLTAGASDVSVSSLVVERTGLAADAALAGVVLLDESGNQMGIAKTLSSEHRATIGEAFVVKAGQSRTLTIAGNRAAAASLGGQTLSLSLVGVNTSAAVNATLPITGTSHTVNETLTVGALSSPVRGSLDPGASQTKEVGTTGYTFSSVKWTAGSQERVYVKSIRWNQTGSAGTADLTNLKTYVDGVAYDTAVSADGKYYTTNFPGKGILLDKGFSKEFSAKGDVVGGSGRKVDLDVAKRADVYAVGETYGYGITPDLAGSAAATDGAAFNNADDYYYDAAEVHISAGTVNVTSWTGVGAQNIAINLANQPLGGFSVDVKGEPVSVGNIVFRLTAVENTGNDVGLNDLTNISVVKEDGTVVAGPKDGSGTSANGTLTFTDTVTFPIGITNLKLVGKLGTDFANNDTLAASTTPSTNWTTITGQVTGNSITAAPTSGVSGQIMTVKAGSFSVTASTQPTARTVIAGAQKFEFARYILDVTASGEDVRVTSLPLAYTTGGTVTNLTSCQIYDGADVNAVSLTTGSNVVNPSAVSSSTTFTFDGTGLTLQKGTSRTLSLRCNVAVGTTGGYRWGLDDGQAGTGYTAATGLTSGQTIAESFNENVGQLMTAASAGSYTVANDPSLLYKLGQAGASGVEIARFKFTASTAEDLDLRQVALQLGNTASNSPADLLGQRVTLWNGATQVGIAQFGLSNADYATSTLTTAVRITKGETVTLVAKGDLSVQNADEGTPGAFLMLTYDGENVGLTGNYAVGVGSGATISSGTTSDLTTNGLRIFRTVPTFEDVTTSTALAAGSDLYAIKITAGSGRDVGLYKLTFKIATTGATVGAFQLFGPGGAVNASGVTPTDRLGDPADGTGKLDSVEIVFDNNASDRLVPAGTSKTYRLRAGTVTGLTSNNVESLNINLSADTVYPSLVGLLGKAATVDAVATTGENVIWTPFSTTTPTTASTADDNFDFTNGYGAAGYPGVGQDFQTRVFSH